MGLADASSRWTHKHLALLDVRQRIPTCHFLFASLYPVIIHSSFIFFFVTLRQGWPQTSSGQWSGLGSELHVFASAPAAGQIFYITSLGFLPQQDRGQRCASMGLARPSPLAFLFPGMGSSPRGTLSNLSILWLQAEVGEF